ncbi:MAG: hypothetical protein K0U86_02720 [Planctomycetes bacterium]|nr:hypothetical protein [Planctomycetota bacterium]MCH9723803.1 hypothetical protein [Planctomycetota bacterium]MCH9776115.1 hypothetical protein [Planctomycetota bacterium]MCH9791410.1 hypothetical protein [Planctomycetota bacterium]
MSRKAKRSEKQKAKKTAAQPKPDVKQSAGNSTTPAALISEFRQKRFSGMELGFLSLLLIWSFLVACFPMRNMDIWWHLRTGQLILERGTVPYFDWFTFVDFDRPWIDLHWGFQILVTWLYRWGGVDLLILIKAFCLSLTIGFAWYAAGRSVPPWCKALLWILPVICISGRSVVRPEMLSLFYLSFWMFVISCVPAHPKMVWLIPLITLLWVNSHALFVLGLVVSVLFIADHLIRVGAQGRFGLEKPSTAISRFTYIRVGVLTLLACFLNPYLEQGFLFPLTLYEKFSVDQAFYSVRVGEFQPPVDFIKRSGLQNLYLFSQVLLAGLTLMSFVPLLLKKQVNPFRILLFIAFTHLAWKASRNTGIFSLISGIILCDNISDWIRLAVPPKVISAPGSRRENITQTNGLPGITILGSGFSACVFVFLIVSLFSGHWNRWGGEGKVLGLGEQEAWYAHAASKFAGQPGMPSRAFVSNMGQSAVYIFHNGPDRKVFFDGRLEVNTKETFQLYEQIKRQMIGGKADWAYLLQDEEGQRPLIILDSRSSRNEIRGMLTNPGWRLVFADQAAAVFLDVQAAERLQLPVADPRPLAQPPGMRLRK